MGKSYGKKAQDSLPIQYFQASSWQEDMLDVVTGNRITFVDSPAGTGKTTAALFYACRQYLADVTKQIYFVRTPVECGDDKIGFLPGTASSEGENKLGPHYESTKAILKDFIGAGKLECDLDQRIHLTIPNFVLGWTISNATFIIDEAQMLSPMTLKLLLERTGHNTDVIVIGDSKQIYADDPRGKQRNALKHAYKVFFNEDMSPKFPGEVGHYQFPVDAVMRDDIVKTVIRAYDAVSS